MSEKRTGKWLEIAARMARQRVEDEMVNMAYTQRHDERPETYSPYPVLGWRVWSLSPRTSSLDVRGNVRSCSCPMCRIQPRPPYSYILQGVYGRTWPEPYMKAKCYCGVGSPGPVHQIPEWNALCGIYATKNPPSMPGRGSVRMEVVGVVALSDVIEHEHGYRAAEARILALTAAHSEALIQLRESYPSIDIARTPERLLRVWDYFTRHPDEIPPVQHPDLDERNHHGPDWEAPAPYTTDARARDRAYYTAITAGYISYDEARRAFPPITDA